MSKYRTLFAYARPQRRFFIVIFALTVMASAFVALQPWPMKLVVDNVLGGKPLAASARRAFETFSLDTSRTGLLVTAVAGGLILFLLSSALDAVLAWSWTVAGRRMVYDLAEDLFARLQRRSLLFHNRTSIGDTMVLITKDSWSVYQVFDTLLFAPAHALLSIIGMIILMAQLDGVLTILALVIAPFMIGASFLVGKPLRAAAKLKREIETRIQSHIQQTLTGIPVVQAFAQEEREHARFEQFADAVIRAQQRSTLVGSVNSLSSGLITTLGTGVILWVGAHHVMAGTLSIGSILVFLVFLTSLQTQMKVFANIHTALQGFSASIDRVIDILQSAPEIADASDRIDLAAVRGQIRMENVTFGYELGRPVLRGVTLEVQPGETVALIGETGAGKSTLVSLIPRFADVWDGRVLIDGKDVREVRLKTLRQQIAIILQEPFLFPLSIAENIAYGRPDASREEIEEAARAANAHDFIQSLPQGYETVIGERGATLSGGERQRLSIARALLKNAPILILDEPTSALDAETEHSILQALHRLMEGRTTLLIAHRLSTIRRAGRIIVLKAGRIVEAGTHEQLLALDGSYARLHNLQFDTRKQVASAAG